MSNKYPLISVCIPAYNHEKYITECIESVMAQTYPNIELIILDDGSKDSTWKLLCGLKEKCEKRFTRVVFKTQENSGICVTTNLLWRTYAQGEYIFDMASDDKILPNTISLLYEHINTHPDIGLVLGKNLIMDSESKQCYWDTNRNIVYDEKKAIYTSFTDFIEKTTKITTNSKQYGQYASLCRINHIANGWLIRRKMLLNNIPPFTPEAPLEDWWLMLQISKVAKIQAIDNPTYFYRWHQSNTIKHEQKMIELAYKTRDYEKKQIENMKDKKWLMLFKNIHYSFNLYFISLYKITENNYRLKILKLFGKKFILKKKESLKSLTKLTQINH